MPDSPREFLGVFRYSRRALELVWTTSRRLTLILAVVTVLAGVLPAAIAYVGALIIDAVVAAARLYQDSGTAQYREVMSFVAIEGGLVAALAGTQRALSACQSLLRAQLGQRVNVMILEKALQLELAQFEDSEFYDKLTRARREASSRPLSLVIRTFGLGQNAVSLVSYGVLLAQFSGWAVLVLVLAGLPAFLAEAKFSGDAFRLFRWRSPDTRMQMYLETVLAREDHAKEVQLFGLGPRLLDRYREIFHRLYREDRNLTLRRDSWGFALGLMGTLTLYGAYAWVAFTTVVGRITLGQMTMYMMLFRQGQAAVSASLSAIGGMYEDNLYLSTLYEFLETPVPTRSGAGMTAGHRPHRRHPLRARQLHLSGQRMLRRSSGIDAAYPTRRVASAGRRERLRQDHAHQAPRRAVCANLEGASCWTDSTCATGTPRPCDSASASSSRTSPATSSWWARTSGPATCAISGTSRRWLDAAEKLGMALPFIETLPGRLRSAAWQVVQGGARAVRRPMAENCAGPGVHAFGRRHPRARRAHRGDGCGGGVHRVRALPRASPATSITILISHRFSTVRMADQIVVIDAGRIVERGSHEQLMALDGHYARLFSLQARGYR
jgi:ATP-binding cassette, subfamily B, bacterial